MGALKKQTRRGGRTQAARFVHLKLDLEAVFYGLCALGCTGGIRKLVQDGGQSAGQVWWLLWGKEGKNHWE